MPYQECQIVARKLCITDKFTMFYPRSILNFAGQRAEHLQLSKIYLLYDEIVGGWEQKACAANTAQALKEEQ